MRRWILGLLLAMGTASCDDAKPAAEPAPAPAAQPETEGAKEPATAPDATAQAAVDTQPAQPEEDTAPPEPPPPDVPWDVKATGVQPLSDEVREIFWNTPEDPPTEAFMGVDEEHEGRRYLQGDEYALFLFHEHLQDQAQGGAYLGVGSDQAYVLIGWTRPDVAFLIDYDPWVVTYHKAFHAFFEVAETPEDFLSYWKKDGAEKAVALLEKVYAEDEEMALVVRLYKRQRSRTLKRFEHYDSELFTSRKAMTYVNDKAQYHYIRAMVLADRIRPMSTNLLDDEGMVGIGKATHDLKLPMRALYLSNAEQYWNYSEQFRTNIKSFLFDDKSLVIRTLGSFSHNKDYRYYLQGAANFIGWMEHKKIYDAWCKTAEGCSIYRLVDRSVGRRKLAGEGDYDLQIIDKEVPWKEDEE